MEPLKEMFNRDFFGRLAEKFGKADKNFNPEKFRKEVTEDIEPLSLNQRMRKTSLVLKEHLPSDYRKALSVMKKVIPGLDRGYTNLVFPDFVGLYGHSDFDASMEALAFFTGFGSSEFAIREFLKRDFPRTIKVMKSWAGNKDHHIRRLASEGSRPRLPWSFKLEEVIRKPELTQPILEKLKADPEIYVRKSVANHLNDISKENPDFMLELVNRWDKTHPHTAWIIKHASRSLLKKGHNGSLSVFDFEKNPKVSVEKFQLSSGKLKLGEILEFKFDVVSGKAQAQKLLIDYKIHYRKKTGGLSAKVFKLKELELKPKARVSISKKQVFRDFTTRKHFAGGHIIEIQVNGKILGRQDFKLLV
jgi:3-methyladenine DNA glycosylase AlkC